MAAILVVEDDLATSEFFAEFLSWNGYESHVAASGAEALAIVKKRVVDAVLLDYRLPDVDGEKLCPQLRATLGDSIPIILLTGDYAVGRDEMDRDCCVSEYLRKPIEPAALLGRLTALVA